MKYKVVFVEDVCYRQFSGEIEANTEEEAIQKGKDIFTKENPDLRAHYKLLWCSKIIR